MSRATKASDGGSASKQLDALSARSNNTLEVDGGAQFLKAVYDAFPTTSINTLHLTQIVPTSGKPRLNRVFHGKRTKWRTIIADTRSDLIRYTLEVGKTIQPPVGEDARLYFEQGDLQKAPPYTSPQFEEIEIDCLAKVVLPIDFTWETSSAASTTLRLFAEHEKDQQLPERAAPVAERKASVSSFDSSASDESTISAKHYPHNASHYILGEVYHTSGKNIPFQKLLQMERALRFILVKEQASGIEHCVAGALFIGKFDNSQRSRMVKMLLHYKQALPLLASLHAAKRFLCISAPQHSTTAVDLMHQVAKKDRAIAKLIERVDKLEERLEADSQKPWWRRMLGW